ncbi:hypothetical protein KSAC_00710 [Komagataeibacter saccharivorans]|nr:hypothetical protein KSAC_00710 [Komagataeibacter saccharivorans]
MQFVHFEQAPPRSWDHFEELCADVFQEEWRDSGLVRHGRAGQPQDGVDIVGRDGALWPVGIQCKKKSVWPVKTLSRKDLKSEVEKAKNFKPALKAFYLVSTSPDDENIQNYARDLTIEHNSSGLFTVNVIGWSELVRRATRHPRIAAKHFGAYSAGQPNPLLASWRASGAKLLLDDAELAVAIRELVYDFREFPAGRIAFRKQESDDLLLKICKLQAGASRSLERRKMVVKHREELYIHTEDEESTITGLKLLLGHPDISEYVRIVWEKHSPLLIRSFIEQQIDPDLCDIAGKEKIRLIAPQALPDPAGSDIPVFISKHEHSEMVRYSFDLKAKYPNLDVETMTELFNPVQFGYAVPSIIRRIVRGIRSGIPLCAFEEAKWLEFHLWKASF